MYQTNQTTHDFKSEDLCVFFLSLSLVALRNYINHGSKNGDVGAARGFAIETLPAITSFKLGKLGWSCWEPGGYLLGISLINLDAIKVACLVGGTGVFVKVATF